MNARTLFWGTGLPLIALVFLILSGCSNSEQEPNLTGGAYEASGGRPAQTMPDAEQSVANGAESLPETPAEIDTSQPNLPPGSTGSTSAEQAATPFKIAGSESTSEGDAANQGLRPDISPQQLLDFLSTADQNLQLVYSNHSGITDPKEAHEVLIRIVKDKLEASRRLANHADADADARSEGARGELQALSHLASLGDVQVATELEKLAEANLTSSDEKLASDSRLVLIGFALESLHNGSEAAPDRILGYLQQIADNPTQADVPTMMVMGAAKQTLADQGYSDQAAKVRSMIIELFADSPEPEIARMAAQLAGNVHFDEIEKQRADLMRGETVEPAQWRQSVVTLIDESADLQTVQYLAGSALEFESLGLDEIIEVTYDVLSKRFSDPQSATGHEVIMALEARQARRDVIGRVFEPSLPSVDGSPLLISDYSGQVVMMPFWATGFPDSLQLVPRLKAICDSHPDQVAIVGINLDTEDASVQKFLANGDLGFPSFRAESSPTAKIANPVAARFGMVSLPFVAILDKKGQVAALNFTGKDLEQTVERLIQQE